MAEMVASINLSALSKNDQNKYCDDNKQSNNNVFCYSTKWGLNLQ